MTILEIRGWKVSSCSKPANRQGRTSLGGVTFQIFERNVQQVSSEMRQDLCPIRNPWNDVCVQEE